MNQALDSEALATAESVNYRLIVCAVCDRASHKARDRSEWGPRKQQGNTLVVSQ